MDINGLKYDELVEAIDNLAEKKYRAEQIFRFFHQQNGKSITELKIIPEKLRKKLSENFTVSGMSIFKRFDSKLDDTVKYLFLLDDGNIIESVVMKYKHGYTICISTQVGCKMGCSFCASTKDGLIRNLSSAEMLYQLYLAEEDLDIRISNIVLMGSGEPLDNLCNVKSFFGIINHELGRRISMRNITLSTCGVVPGIFELAELNLPITLSVSLHSPFDKNRAEIMPIARKYGLDELFNALALYYDKTSRRITFEYTLIEGENDRDEDVNELVRLLSKLPSHINLIPLNPISEYNRNRTGRDRILEFQKKLITRGIQTTIRKELGSDISASCGQLRRSVLDDNF
ncbi:MAG: 23S rRNA (adenine(2503)-C(2))-methyltransferase RlmN [Gudongella sp.]|jgi:23S rRNA (adenine2503-C2)-methyltransferase|nr:23S rRNA (adenine(2503)-C(2))-methyltransferase RlmN [Gudongella sp.]